MKCRLIVITEIIAPYRIPVFNTLATHPEIDLLVVFLSETDPSLRQWHIYKEEIRFRYQVLPSFRWRLGRYNLLLNRRVAATLSRITPDVILCGGYTYLAAWQAASWAHRHRVPLLLWTESTAADQRHLRPAVEALKRRFLRRCAGFAAAGQSSRQYLQQFGIADRNIFTAPDAVDNDYFCTRAEIARNDALTVKHQLNLPPRYFLNVGRLIEAKGVFDLLEAYAKLDAELRSIVSLVFVGNGVAQSELARRAEAISPGRVEFRGFLQREELPAVYALAEVLVFPTHSDPWGLVVNEAMASGLPVIATDVAGCTPDLVLDSITGFVVPAHNPDRLAEALLRVATDREQTLQMGRQAALKIQDHSPAACAAGMAEAALSVGGKR
jgi:glycosyltransferase involved in cell wall biosynthesis